MDILPRESLVSLFFGAYIICSWLIVWVHSVSIDRRMSSKRPTKLLHPQLVVYSTLFILIITVFYLVSYAGIDILIIETTLNSSPSVSVSAMFAIAIGVYLIIEARKKMKDLHSVEVLYSLNDTHSRDGIYTHMRHPMYVGISMILISSFCIFPTMLGALVLMFAFLLIGLKIRVEKIC